MAERSGWSSEKLKAEVREKRTAMGVKFTRQLTVDEQKAFIDEDKVPVGALSKSSFKMAKHIEALPNGAKCMTCGNDVGGLPGYIVKLDTANNPLRIICEQDYNTVMGGTEVEVDDTENLEESLALAVSPVATTTPPVAGVGGGDPVAAALQTLTAALSTPKAPPVDEAKIIAEAVAQAKTVAETEAKGILAKSIADFLKDGTTPSVGGEEEESPLPAAKKDGVDAATTASGWSAKATPAAKDAVDKLTKFLSEFSYFRDGVSMRLINTFARHKDKKEALKSYCEVSQMEDLPDLIEKMKSPEFAEVCNAYASFAPRPLNKRFAVFYGSPGGGKTYAAIKAGEKINDGQCDIVPCSPSMDAADMLYAYRLDYKSGKRGYVPTALLTAMLAGRAVVLDEVNLLPMEARMFLQNILDNKNKVSVMGVELPIRDGFFVIGTMNLETGLGTSPLPLPLVDRACVVKEFKTSVSQAAVGAGLC